MPLAGLLLSLFAGVALFIGGIFTAPLWVRLFKLAKKWAINWLTQAKNDWEKPDSDSEDKMRTQNRNSSQKGQGTIGYILIIALVAAVLGAIFFFVCFRRVDPGTIGVVVDYKQTTNGKPTIIKAPTGIYFWVDPVWQKMIAYPISQQTLTMVAAATEGRISGDDSTLCQDRNGVQNHLDSRTMYRADPAKAGDLYLLRPGMPLISDGEDDIEFQIVRPQVISAISKACSQFTYAEITGEKKTELETKINDILRVSLAANNIILDQFMLGQVIPPENQKAALDAVAIAELEAKKAFFQRQEQENLAAGRIAAAEGDKQVAILQAEAQAESIRIVQEQLNKSPDYINFLYATKFNGVGPTTLVIGNGQYPLTIPLPYGTTPVDPTR